LLLTPDFLVFVVVAGAVTAGVVVVLEFDYPFVTVVPLMVVVLVL
jgi:hypothetical protein